MTKDSLPKFSDRNGLERLNVVIVMNLYDMGQMEIRNGREHFSDGC